MKSLELKVSASLLKRVANGENTVNIQECVLVNIVSEKHKQAMGVLCNDIELVNGKFNPLQLFRELGYTVIEWFDENKPDYIEGIFNSEENKQSFFVILNESGFVMKVAYGLTDTVDFGSGWGMKFTAKPCTNLNDNIVNGFLHEFKKRGYEVTLKR